MASHPPQDRSNSNINTKNHNRTKAVHSRKHNLSDQEDDGQQSDNGSHQEGSQSPVSKTAKSEGKTSVSSPDLRKEQNRAAQRAFRDRKERYLQQLEHMVNELKEQQLATTTQFQQEIKQLKSHLEVAVRESYYLREVVFAFESALCKGGHIAVLQDVKLELYRHRCEIQQSSQANTNKESPHPLTLSLPHTDSSTDIQSYSANRDILYKAPSPLFNAISEGCGIISLASSSLERPLVYRPTYTPPGTHLPKHTDYTKHPTVFDELQSSLFPPGTLQSLVQSGMATPLEVVNDDTILFDGQQHRSDTIAKDEQDGNVMVFASKVGLINGNHRLQNEFKVLASAPPATDPNISSQIYEIPHDPRIDLIPCPKLRAQMILHQNKYDHDKLFQLLVDKAICHGSPLDTHSWELPDEFFDRFGFLLGLDMERLRRKKNMLSRMHLRRLTSVASTGPLIPTYLKPKHLVSDVNSLPLYNHNSTRNLSFVSNPHRYRQKNLPLTNQVHSRSKMTSRPNQPSDPVQASSTPAVPTTVGQRRPSISTVANAESSSPFGPSSPSPMHTRSHPFLRKLQSAIDSSPQQSSPTVNALGTSAFSTSSRNSSEKGRKSVDEAISAISSRKVGDVSPTIAAANATDVLFSNRLSTLDLNASVEGGTTHDHEHHDGCCSEHRREIEFNDINLPQLELVSDEARRFTEQLLGQNKAWAKKTEEERPGFFAKLEKQQKPQVLWIGCSDSRVPANQIVNLDPGEIFVHRNIANVVTHTDMNLLSVLEYAVEVLKVRHIIICGHYGCGGVAASLAQKEFGIIDNWLRNIKDLYTIHRKKFDTLPHGSKEQQDLLTELNVIQSALNVCHTSIIQRAWSRGAELSIHGWCYRLSDGVIRNLGLCIEGPGNVEDVYQVSNYIKKQE
ncbi:hypothetical protein BGZ49_006817 [Haplosporangium sp. Z 27]|nr:hypothetical protein BGZ49_006817 [Haplosporangium sp. Z 27]